MADKTLWSRFGWLLWIGVGTICLYAIFILFGLIRESSGIPGVIAVVVWVAALGFIAVGWREAHQARIDASAHVVETEHTPQCRLFGFEPVLMTGCGDDVFTELLAFYEAELSSGDAVYELYDD